MATTKSQRITIWVIAGAMIVGTIGGFAAMMVAPGNEARDQARFDELMAAYNTEYEAYETKVQERDTAIAAELSAKYYETFKQYETRPAAFEKDDVKELSTHDLVTGDGDELKDDSSFWAYYIGWNPSGTVFDSSIVGEELRMPIEAAPGRVISGWTEGAAGMKVGGIRELTIPAEQAYGEEGSGDDIPANTPLKFVIMVVSAPDLGEELAMPKMSRELTQLYARRMNISPAIVEQMYE